MGCGLGWGVAWGGVWLGVGAWLGVGCGLGWGLGVGAWLGGGGWGGSCLARSAYLSWGAGVGDSLAWVASCAGVIAGSGLGRTGPAWVVRCLGLRREGRRRLGRWVGRCVGGLRASARPGLGEVGAKVDRFGEPRARSRPCWLCRRPAFLPRCLSGLSSREWAPGLCAGPLASTGPAARRRPFAGALAGSVGRERAGGLAEAVRRAPGPYSCSADPLGERVATAGRSFLAQASACWGCCGPAPIRAQPTHSGKGSLRRVARSSLRPPLAGGAAARPLRPTSGAERTVRRGCAGDALALLVPVCLRWCWLYPIGLAVACRGWCRLGWAGRVSVCFALSGATAGCRMWFRGRDGDELVIGSCGPILCM